MITDVLGPVFYRLALPATMVIHNVFHANLIRPANQDSFPRQVNPPPPLIVTDGEDEYEVEEILDSRRLRYRIQYYVK